MDATGCRSETAMDFLDGPHGDDFARSVNALVHGGVDVDDAIDEVARHHFRGRPLTDVDSTGVRHKDQLREFAEPTDHRGGQQQQEGYDVYAVDGASGRVGRLLRSDLSHGQTVGVMLDDPHFHAETRGDREVMGSMLDNNIMKRGKVWSDRICVVEQGVEPPRRVNL
jgi:hypothetical protein